MATTKKRATNTTAAAVEHVSVRMYRQGLGDCFLITFPRPTGTPFYMLIDCGVVLGTAEPETQMKNVVTDITAVTGGQIDLLVVTHEHWDHVSGFDQAKDLFDLLKVQPVWVAWTEDPADALATKLRGERRLAPKPDRHRTRWIMRSSARREASLATANRVSRRSRWRICRGSDFFVMGPPKDETLIKKSNPGENEAYGLDAGPDGSQALLVAGLMGTSGASAGAAFGDDSIEHPFDAMYEIPLARAQQKPFFERRYFGNATDGGLHEKSTAKDIADQSWRRIDATWMGASATMALQLDSATNNTSLVLAIEVMATKQILLFPGDAQAGNWLSWQDLKWTVDGKTVTGADLLARTTFYKVGHHGSHKTRR